MVDAWFTIYDNCVTYEEAVISAESGDSGSGSIVISTSEGKLYKTVTIDSSAGWTHTFTDLPLTGTDTDGNTANYYYYVEEVSVPNYTTSYDNNGGIQSGTITVTNQAVENPTFELPETGGPGTRIAYTLGSILMLLASAAFLYIKKRNDGKKGGLA
ncbi:MAG: Cna B-type domain-containing protein [Lachnospiraceae bacterium]|nr:Cna B-type domain-containing protein [Lachnospiraceae bacterium]